MKLKTKRACHNKLWRMHLTIAITGFLVILAFFCSERFLRYDDALKYLAFCNNESCEEIDDDNVTSNWPRIDSFLALVPLKPNEVGQFEDLFLKSYTLFWPLRLSRTTLTLVVDQEANGTESFDYVQEAAIKQLKIDCCHKRRFNLAVNYLPSFANNSQTELLLQDDHDRRQWAMFWADNYTRPNAEFIALVDPDTVFVTRVTLMDLFVNETCPIVRPLFGKPTNDWWANASKTSYALIGRKEPFDCNTYFPMVIKVAHLRLIRDHIRTRLHSETFDEAFFSILANKTETPYSTFNIFCTYLWYYQRDSYYWAIGERDPYWFGQIPYEKAATLEEAEVAPDLVTQSQTPHLAVHWSHETFKNDENALQDVLRTGICYSMPNEEVKRPTYCEKLIGPNRSNSVNIFEWRFESFIKIKNVTSALSAHQNRLASNDQVPGDWDYDLIRNI